jgi:hypothetical protein
MEILRQKVVSIKIAFSMLINFGLFIAFLIKSFAESAVKANSSEEGKLSGKVKENSWKCRGNKCKLGYKILRIALISHSKRDRCVYNILYLNPIILQSEEVLELLEAIIYVDIICVGVI